MPGRGWGDRRGAKNAERGENSIIFWLIPGGKIRNLVETGLRPVSENAGKYIKRKDAG